MHKKDSKTVPEQDSVEAEQEVAGSEEEPEEVAAADSAKEEAESDLFVKSISGRYFAENPAIRRPDFIGR